VHLFACEYLTLAHMDLPAQQLSQTVLASKYLQPGESSIDQVLTRVARAVASAERPEHQKRYEKIFLEHLQHGSIGAGRIMANAGSPGKATLMNCFVQPVGDSISGCDENGLPGIYEALRESAETMRCGGGVGYDFSAIRPKGAWISSTRSTASGPCRFIDLFDASAAALRSAGGRRGAQMGVLRVDHPDILEFIAAKQARERWTNFNVSVAVSDAFIDALEHNAIWSLTHSARPGPEWISRRAHQREADGKWVYQSLPARAIWQALLTAAYEVSEPGVLFTDHINRDNNLHDREVISATNPCGEQPLPAYGSCNLGPLILPRFVVHPFDRGGVAAFDFKKFIAATRRQVRMLDNVLDITDWPLAQQQIEAASKRRIGIGFTGLGDALIMLGLRYDRPEGCHMAARIARTLRDTAYIASAELAQEKGPFPLFSAKTYLADGTFASRLPAAIKKQISVTGCRNSHLLSIAPAGSVSIAFADNTSNGIEPAFAWSYRRRIQERSGQYHEILAENHAWRLYRAWFGRSTPLPVAFVCAPEIDARRHLAMMRSVQPFIDGGISKTINLPDALPFFRFRELYLLAWRYGLKGFTTFRSNPERDAVLLR
jgi:ribonucleoside-diphosphate reductase alpha chain